MLFLDSCHCNMLKDTSYVWSPKTPLFYTLFDISIHFPYMTYNQNLTNLAPYIASILKVFIGMGFTP